jgi:hypothetical protein
MLDVLHKAVARLIEEVLDFKPVPRLEPVGDIQSKQVDNHKHRIG